MPLLHRTPRNLHKLVKLQHPPLAATPPLAPLVKHRLARVMHALLTIPRLALCVLRTARPPPTRSIDRDLCVWVVGLVLWRRRGGASGRGSVRARGGERVRVVVVGNGYRLGRVDGDGDWGWGQIGLFLGLGRGGVVDGGVGSRRARRDGEEFFKGEDARFAAFPAWG